MTDKDERYLNSLLASAIRKGEISSDLTDQTVDRVLAEPAAEISKLRAVRIRSRLKQRIEDTAIVAACAGVKVERKIPFGRYVEGVRERAGLDRQVIGERLKKSADFVERLERGHINPLQLSTNDFVDITELFHIRFSLLPAMVDASLAAASAKHGFQAIARSHGGFGHDQRGEDVERALEAFARNVKPKTRSGGGSAEEIQRYLTKVEAELKRRGRTDLTA